MRSHKRFFAAALISSALSLLSGPIASADAVPAYDDTAVHDIGRPHWDVARDPDRKPADVLAFSQIKRGMVVVDLVPGDGYYTRMLSALVGPKGKVYAVVPGGDSRALRMAQREGKPPSFIPVDPGTACALGCYETGRPGYMLAVDEVLALENITEYSNVTVLWEGLNNGDLAVPEQVDAVFTADGYHELHYKDLPALPISLAGRGTGAKPKPLNTLALNKGIFRAMKNGGVYLVIDYDAAKGNGFDDADTLHRTESAAVKAEITDAGFVLDGESKALAMASDDHTKAADGVAEARDKTDQYLLRFKKPANAPDTNGRPNKAQEAAIMKSYYGHTWVGDTTAKGVSSTGVRLRTGYYSPDHTYQEFGRIGDGPGPMQSGTWFWDADGHNCELHQYPLDERANTVCHKGFVKKDGLPSTPILFGGGAHQALIPGYILKGWVLP